MKALYKFIADSKAVPFLLRGLIKFTPPAELNDPSELTPNVIREEVEASLYRLRRDGYNDEDLSNLRCQQNLFQKLAPRFQAVAVPQTAEEATNLLRYAFYDQISLLEELLTDMAEEVSCKVGLFCLSQRYDSLPMWAHYANNGRGLVVEFKDLEDVFEGDDTGILSKPIAVRYERDILSVTFDTQSHYALFFAKFPDWRYEEEIRIILPLTECDKQVVGDYKIHLRKIPPRCISRLILGWNMPDHVKKEIRVYVKRINPIVVVVNARITRGRVELEP